MLALSAQPCGMRLGDRRVQSPSLGRVPPSAREVPRSPHRAAPTLRVLDDGDDADEPEKAGETTNGDERGEGAQRKQHLT
eukprot:2342122-Rhodomonas_salina.2